MSKRAPKSPNNEEVEGGTMKQQNVRFQKWLLARAKAAAKWEAMGFSTYIRKALLKEVRRTEAERAKAEGKA